MVRAAPVATWDTVDSGTTIRPRRPGRRSRADHAVTASRSRSMRYWSAMSTASDRHEARGQHGEHHHRGPDDGRREVAAGRRGRRARTARRRSTIHTRSASSGPGRAPSRPRPRRRRPARPCRGPAAAAPGSGPTATASAAAAANAGATRTRCAANRPTGSTPTTAAASSSPTATRAQVVVGLGGERAGEDGEQARPPRTRWPTTGRAPGSALVGAGRPGRTRWAGGPWSSRPARRRSRRRPRRARRRAAAARRCGV